MHECMPTVSDRSWGGVVLLPAGLGGENTCVGREVIKSIDLGGSGGMPPRKFLKFRCSEVAFGDF